jgi:DNA-binding protein WhiA
MLKQIFDLTPEIIVRRQSLLRKNNVYEVRVHDPDQVKEVLMELHLTDVLYGGQSGIPADYLKTDCCRRAYLRGAFLGGGSLVNPEKTYHLEINTENEEYCRQLSMLIEALGLKSGVHVRKNGCVVYVKDAETIVTLLNMMGAHTALLGMESIRVMKGVRNDVNRLVNCETANLSKTVAAAMEQKEFIEYIDHIHGIDNLPKNLEKIARLRLEFPEASLKELGMMVDPPLSKSGVRHRMDRIKEIALDVMAERGEWAIGDEEKNRNG